MFSTEMSQKNKNVQTSVSYQSLPISAEWPVISDLSLWLMGCGEVVTDHLGLAAGKLGGLLTSYGSPLAFYR